MIQTCKLKKKRERKKKKKKKKSPELLNSWVGNPWQWIFYLKKKESITSNVKGEKNGWGGRKKISGVKL